MLTPCMLIAYEILSCIIIGVVGYTPDIDTNDGYIQHYKLNSRREVNAEDRYGRRSAHVWWVGGHNIKCPPHEFVKIHLLFGRKLPFTCAFGHI